MLGLSRPDRLEGLGERLKSLEDKLAELASAIDKLSATSGAQQRGLAAVVKQLGQAAADTDASTRYALADLLADVREQNARQRTITDTVEGAAARLAADLADQQARLAAAIHEQEERLSAAMAGPALAAAEGVAKLLDRTAMPSTADIASATLERLTPSLAEREHAAAGAVEAAQRDLRAELAKQEARLTPALAAIRAEQAALDARLAPALAAVAAEQAAAEARSTEHAYALQELLLARSEAASQQVASGTADTRRSLEQATELLQGQVAGLPDMLARTIQPANVHPELRSAIVANQQAPLERIQGALELDRQARSPLAGFAAPSQPSPFDGAGAWRRISGPEFGGWIGGYRIRGFCSRGADLYCSVVAPLMQQYTGVWRRSGDTWTQLLGSFIDPALAQCESNALMSTDAGVLVAVSGPLGGLWLIDDRGAQRLPTAAWWGDEPVGAYTLCRYGGGVAVGLDPAEVSLFADGLWTRLAGEGERFSWRNNELDASVYTLLSVNGDLLAGLALRGYGPTSAMVWRLRADAWTVIGGEGVRNSWAHPHISNVLDLVEHDGSPIALLTRPKTLPAGAVSIHALQQESWRPVARDGTPWSMHTCHIFNHAVSWRGRLYVGAGDVHRPVVEGRPKPRQFAAVYELSDDSGAWRCVGGDGTAWADTPLTDAEASANRVGGLWIYRMHVHLDQLVCGFAGHAGAAEVWMYTPQSDAPVAGGPSGAAPSPPRRRKSSAAKGGQL